GGARSPPAWARRGGAGRTRGHTRLLPGGPKRAHRRRSAAAVRLGAQAPRSARSDRRLPRPPGGKRGVPTELRKLRTLVAKGLAATDAMWPAIRIAYGW